MSLDDFWNAPDLRTIRNVISGATERENEQVRQLWETMRMGVTIYRNLNRGQKDKVLEPHELLPLSWDDNSVHEQTEEEWREELKRREAHKKFFDRVDASRATAKDQEE